MHLDIFATIEERLQTLSDIEIKIAGFLLENRTVIATMSIRELAQACGVSEASISRFCRNFGYKNFKSFKLAIATQLASQNFSPASLSSLAIGEEPLSALAIIDHAINTSEKAISSIRDTLEDQQIEAAAQAMINANKVMIFGVGGSYPVVLDGFNKMARLGISLFQSNDVHMAIAILSRMNPGDVILLVSTSGKTRAIIELADYARDREITVIGLSSLNRTPLFKRSDIYLATPQLENDVRIATLTSRLAQLVILDSLFLTAFNRLAPDISNSYYEVRQWVDDYKQ
ncbi:MurR/RpiR family transcriptional regulator [Culicoidibacter larvae]|uniref:MurR/RpiR family transcriptional regulator n=1 Tax=Culicoidibacter larvae TaxID=2579976 RepID=A0A5R8QAM1_9FIRM|nr:MurR/RpiR family transcriptional regulator [Culicoidibacter larvae]